jgi:hypothetical protein
MFGASRLFATLVLATSVIWTARALESIASGGPITSTQSDGEARERGRSGKQLFTREEFGGNGRTWHREHGPYFHDNSAKTLEDVLDHYDFFLRRAGSRFGFTGLTPQDKADIIAFLKLL